jgi:hypothetical protein
MLVAETLQSFPVGVIQWRVEQETRKFDVARKLEPVDRACVGRYPEMLDARTMAA